jgi:hypothetical protein
MSPFDDLQTIGNDENVFAVTFDPTSFDLHGQPPCSTLIHVGFKTISVRRNMHDKKTASGCGSLRPLQIRRAGYGGLCFFHPP